MSPARIRGWDQSWGFADPATAAAKGFRVVSGYLSHDPGKNLTPADVVAYHQHGIAVLLNWESHPGRPLAGAVAGREDGADAKAQADDLISHVGYAPRNRLSIYFSCDTDVTRSDFPLIERYYAATKAAVSPKYGNGCYGEADLVDFLHSKGLTVSEWQTIAWSYGRLSPEADFYQTAIEQRLGGAAVDFDEVIHQTQLGAWWPPGHALNRAPTSNVTPAAPTDLLEEIMALYKDRAEFEAALARIVADQLGNIWDAKTKEQHGIDWIVETALNPLEVKVDAIAKKVGA